MKRGHCGGLELKDHFLKIAERVFERSTRQQVDIDEMRLGFRIEYGTKNAMFILRRFQEKYLAKKKKLYFAFVDLKKAFD